MDPIPPLQPLSDPSAVDNEHLRLLAIFHYVLGGITALFACIPIIHVVVGAFFILARANLGEGGSGGPPTALFGWLFVIFGGVAVLMGWTLAIATIASGRYIAQRKNRIFSIVVAGIQCAFAPFGTVLGVFTLIVLMRDSVRRQYPS